MRHALFALALCTAGAASGAEPDEAAAKANARAFEEVQKKKPDRALKLLAPHVARHETTIADAQSRGLAYCATNPGEARIYASMAADRKKEAVIFGNEVCEALFLKAFALTDLGRKDEALATMQRLTALAPMHGQYFNELGYSYRVAGQIEEARRAYQSVVDMPPLLEDRETLKRDRAVALRGLGYLLIDKGDLDGAEDRYRRSLELDPDNAIARSELEFIARQRQKAAQ